jgi:hypothetical protein
VCRVSRVAPAAIGGVEVEVGVEVENDVEVAADVGIEVTSTSKQPGDPLKSAAPDVVRGGGGAAAALLKGHVCPWLIRLHLSWRAAARSFSWSSSALNDRRSTASW